MPVAAMTHDLILIRHAKSDYPPGVDDHDRPLNARGMRDAPRIGAWLAARAAGQPRDVTCVLVSTARRTQLTWLLASGAMGAAASAWVDHDEPRIYEASARALADVVGELRESCASAVLIGHNPGLDDLVAELTDPVELAESGFTGFKTSTIAVLRTEDEWPVAVSVPGSFRVVDHHVARG
jgi:phosphohistidine phosphatase